MYTRLHRLVLPREEVASQIADRHVFQSNVHLPVPHIAPVSELAPLVKSCPHLGLMEAGTGIL